MEITTLCAVVVSLTVVPNKSQFLQYESVTLSCEGRGDSFNWRVKRNTSMKISEDCPSYSNRTKDSTCYFDFLYEVDSGVYWCESADGKRSQSILLTVTDEPLILESPAHPVNEGEALTLHCRTSTTSLSPTRFYRNGILIGSSSSRNLTIQRVSKHDEGTYMCNISGVGQSLNSQLIVRETGRLESPSSSLSYILLPVLGVCLPLILLMLFCIWRNHKGHVDRAVSYTDVTISQEVKPRTIMDVGLKPTFYSRVKPETS